MSEYKNKCLICCSGKLNSRGGNRNRKGNNSVNLILALLTLACLLGCLIASYSWKMIKYCKSGIFKQAASVSQT